MEKDIQDVLLSLIKKSLSEASFDTISEDDVFLDLPTDSRFGDLSTNIAFRLSKQFKKSPQEIANNILSAFNKNLEKNPIRIYIDQIKVDGPGFINFYFTDQYFYEKLGEIIKDARRVFKVNVGKSKRVLIEFVSANPTGPLSVAHARQAVVGDVLANMLSFLGFRIKREYYLNDEGNQINILASSVALRQKELNGETIEFPDNYYQGEYIYDIAKETQELKIKEQNLSNYIVDYILKIIKRELDDFGVKFDYWFSQKKLRESGKIKKALEFLRKKEFLYEKDNALWFKSTLFGDDKDRVVIKSDGSYTYLAPDIAYHQDKYRRGFQWLINLWGPDHHGYINRLKASVEAIGKKPDSLSIIIVQLATIFRQGEPVHMSTRKGQYITLREVLDEVGPDAARFFFLMRRTSSHLDFDLDIAKKQTSENPVYYIQYAHARICSILRNSHIKVKPSFKLSILKEKEEIGLIKKLLQFNYILKACLSTQDPYMLTIYLQEVSEAFHKFYDLHRVLGQPDELTKARLALIEATRIVIAQALNLLGVSKPQKM